MKLGLHLLIPELIALGVLLFLLFVELFGKKSPDEKKREPLLNIAMGGAAVTLFSLILFSGKTAASTAFNGMFILDPFALFFKTLFTVSIIFLIPMTREFFAGQKAKSGEFVLVLWSSLMGLFFLVSANDLMTVFVALEIFTLSLYILAAYLKSDLVSIESSLKYLILGSLASAFVIFGISLIYVACGATGFAAIQTAFTGDPHNSLMLLGLLLMISGLGFKIASVPFQLWVPDVYEGAPAPVVAYLAVGSKAAGFAVLMRLLFMAFPAFEAERQTLFSILAAMTLLYGNLCALVQTNIKRLFGYSSIGHAGYIMIGLAAGQDFGTAASLYYLIAYALMNLAAFMVITITGRELRSDRLDAYRGLGKRSPFLAAVLFIALLSLAGVPPLAGFFGKFLVLLAGVRAHLDWLSLLGALCVAVSLFYYLSIVRRMYFEDAAFEQPLKLSTSSKLVMVFLIAGIIFVGLVQSPFLGFAEQAAKSLF